MILKDLRTNLHSRMASKIVKHTTPAGSKSKSQGTKAPEENAVKPKGMFEKLDHPDFYTSQQKARLDRMDDLHKDTHQKMMTAQKVGNVNDVSFLRKKLNDIRHKALKKKEDYRQEMGANDKKMDV